MKSLKFLGALTFSIISIVIAVPSSTLAVNANQFDAGRIIDDSVFTDATSMNVNDIQNFLNSKVKTCDTNHSVESGSMGETGPWVCLKDFSENGKTAAQIISAAAIANGISPKVLIVSLQKENGLVTDTWPYKWQYRTAMGYGCPDGADCAARYFGFTNQVNNAAWQFKQYMIRPQSYSYAVGVNNILYNPTASCGRSTVNIRTKATAALYNYTPYQPNAAALANLYGTGNACSAYGNRNFWRYFNDWFGSTINDSNVDKLSFIRINHSGGNSESVTYSSLSDYSYNIASGLTGYPSVSADGCVVPLIKKGGDLSFVRLNHSSGNTEVVSYSKDSSFTSLSSYSITSYPAVSDCRAVVPAFSDIDQDGIDDLSFIRLNHSSGNVEIVTYSGNSNYKKMIDYQISSYPAVTADRAVRPIYHEGKLTFIRLNSNSGKSEMVTYAVKGGYKNLQSINFSDYPSVSDVQNVTPAYHDTDGDGIQDLTFIRMNAASGNVELVTYAGNTGNVKLMSIKSAGYPSVSDASAVIPIYHP